MTIFFKNFNFHKKLIKQNAKIKGQNSKEVREQVIRARKIQEQRFADENGIYTNYFFIYSKYLKKVFEFFVKNK